jgi:hypothetical protein
MTDQHQLRQVEPGHDSGHVLAEGRHGPAPSTGSRLAVTGQVDGHHREPVGEMANLA